MSSKWCVLVFVLGTMTLFSTTQASHKNSQRTGNNKESVVKSSGLQKWKGDPSDLSLSDQDKQVTVLHRVKREPESMMLKVKLHNGSYLIRKVTSAAVPAAFMPPSPKAVTRVVRGYANSKKKKGSKKGGYGYKKPGYVYTTPKTTPKPLRETIEENDSQSQGPPDQFPGDVRPDKDFETTPAPALDPWDIRDSVPGEPGKDYSVHGSIPNTNFSCEGKTPGFYADTETGCQVFHRCTDDPWYTGQVRVTMDSFLCPNGSLFNQQIYTCDWWGNVDCKGAPDFYQLNDQIGQLEETNAGTIQYVQFSGIRVPPPPGQKRKAPKIIPKSQRGPLPEAFRTKHSNEDYDSGKYNNNNNGGKKSNNGGAGALSSNSNGDPDDPDNLAETFEEQASRSIKALRAEEGEEVDERDRDESSQNIDEVSELPPTRRKSSKKSKAARKSSKKTTTTTTTTTAAPEEEEDDEEGEEDDEEEESNETGEEEEENDEVPEATNDGPQGLIVNRKPNESEEQTDSQNITPPAMLKPPTGDFVGEPVDSEKASTEGSRDGKYVPPRPSSEGPTYIPPTQAPSGGYNYPKPENSLYLPPKQDDKYLPPKQDGTYLPPRREDGYLSGTSPPTATYLPPTPTSSGYDSTNTYSSHPDSYYRKPSTGYGEPNPTSAYGPPRPEPPSREYLPAPQAPNKEYLPSQPQGQSNRDYLPPQQQSPGYLPPKQETPGYLPPQHQSPGYLPPKQETPGYLPPQQQSPGYLPPKQETPEYLPPQQQSPGYLPPKQETPGYLPPQQQSPGYLPPKQETPGYLPPQQQSPGYLPPKQETPGYLPPQQQQSREYLSPQQQQPSREYLPQQQQQNNQGYQSNQGYSSQQPNREYLPPQQPNKEYLPSPPQQQQPNREYLPPQQQNPGYPPSQPSREYLPSPPQQHQGYSAPQQPSREYLPSRPPPQQPSSGYLPGPPPQQPNREYLPAPSQQYLPQQAPNREYLPPRRYSQETRRPVVTVTEHWPAKYDYEAPTSPASVQQYSIPSPTQASPPSHYYGSPNRNHGYQTEYRNLYPPSKQYGQSTRNYNSDYFPITSPTTQSIQYSTIPVQTPPPEGGSYGSHSKPYVVRPPVKIDFYPVPLVSYSHTNSGR